jgi:hypothetical protein
MLCRSHNLLTIPLRAPVRHTDVTEGPRAATPALADQVAFILAGMVRWLNDVRPAATPALSTVPLTVEGIADVTATMFQDRVDWWGG